MGRKLECFSQAFDTNVLLLNLLKIYVIKVNDLFLYIYNNN